MHRAMALRTRLLGLSALASLTALSASGSLGCRGKQEAAPADGIVAAVHTAERTAVEKNTRLLTLTT